MRQLSRVIVGLSLVGLAAGCALTKADKATPDKVFVTGSHIPRRVDARSGSLPEISPLSTYTRDDLVSTGRAYDISDALHMLDPAVTR